jgi:pimeloyl-ACP methyl ester carboxylesterase
MRWGCVTLIYIALFSGGVHAQSTTTVAASPAIPADVLQKMYQRELGKLYDPAQAQRLAAAHALLEGYFATPSQRKQIAAQIEALGLDANVIGRLTRLRMYWPQLNGGVYYINERIGPYNVHYFLGIPPTYDRTTPWPLVIKLPGATPFLTKPPPTPDQVTQFYTGWITDELKLHPDAVVIMPLLNLDELWGPSLPGMNSVIQPMLHAADRVNIDPARVYLIGHSMSAHGVWNLALHYPTYFAAINPLAGSASNDWQRLRLMNLRNILSVVWHDANDDVIKVDAARSIVRALRLQKGEVDYEETKNVGHIPSDAILERTYAKLRARVRALYPADVPLQSNRLETAFNRIDWLQIYQPLRSGDEERMIIPRSSSTLSVYENTWKAEAIISEPNHIEITADNVEAMRIYLNDQMINFNEAVVVRVNHKSRFEGAAKPSIEEMLKDQLVVGRGWRYFSAHIDIDFGGSATRPATSATTSLSQKPQ